MPLVADPGYRLVTAAVAEGISVQPIPGPSAVVTALAASGLPTDSFRFAGFLPPKSGQRSNVLEALDRKSTRLNSSHTVISYAVFCLKKKKHKKSILYINRIIESYF